MGLVSKWLCNSTVRTSDQATMNVTLPQGYGRSIQCGDVFEIYALSTCSPEQARLIVDRWSFCNL